MKTCRLQLAVPPDRVLPLIQERTEDLLNCEIRDERIYLTVKKSYFNSFAKLVKGYVESKGGSDSVLILDLVYGRALSGWEIYGCIFMSVWGSIWFFGGVPSPRIPLMTKWLASVAFVGFVALVAGLGILGRYLARNDEKTILAAIKGAFSLV
jgi:hypothetical protein